jgi:hypothetical protein
MVRKETDEEDVRSVDTAAVAGPSTWFSTGNGRFKAGGDGMDSVSGFSGAMV